MPVSAADQGLIFKDGLQRALRDLGLVGRIGGIELAAAEHVIDHGRNVVVVCACAQEGDQIAVHVLIAGGNFSQFGSGFHFGQRGRQIQFGKTVPGRDIFEQVIQRLDADGRQHRVPFFGTYGDIGHRDSSAMRSVRVRKRAVCKQYIAGRLVGSFRHNTFRKQPSP